MRFPSRPSAGELCEQDFQALLPSPERVNSWSNRDGVAALLIEPVVQISCIRLTRAHSNRKRTEFQIYNAAILAA